MSSQGKIRTCIHINSYVFTNYTTWLIVILAFFLVSAEPKITKMNCAVELLGLEPKYCGLVPTALFQLSYYPKFAVYSELSYYLTLLGVLIVKYTPLSVVRVWLLTHSRNYLLY